MKDVVDLLYVGTTTHAFDCYKEAAVGVQAELDKMQRQLDDASLAHLQEKAQHQEVTGELECQCRKLVELDAELQLCHDRLRARERELEEKDKKLNEAMA